MKTESPLRKHYLVCATYLTLIIAYNLFCHLAADQGRWALGDEQRTLVRSVLYGIAIVSFPLTNVLRYILLRLNQTMPGARNAAQRYLTTVAVTQTLLHSVAVFGLAMFLLGDGFNTLYIFSVLGCLAIYLHRPRLDEYDAINYALSNARD